MSEMFEVVAHALNQNENIGDLDMHEISEEQLMRTDDLYESHNMQLVQVPPKTISPEDSLMGEENGFNIRSVSSVLSEPNTDPFSNLPENWANLDFKRKKSCLLSSIYSTCVTKAINHLEALQNSIDTWANNASQNNNNEVDPVSKTDTSKKLIDLVKKSLTKRQELRFSDNLTSSKSDTMLEINGIGGSVSNQTNTLTLSKDTTVALYEKGNVVVQERKAPLKNLLMSGVLEEILLLVARLEFDRKRTEMLLNQERSNLKKLHDQIETLALRRAVELPLRVQREHDACITDITELNWHISFSQKQERKLIRKVEIGEVVHHQLCEEIQSIKMNTPLIEEKSQYELELIRRIKNASADVDTLLNNAKEKLANTQEASRAAYAKAAKEREQIKSDLFHAKSQLNKAKKRLQDAKDVDAENDRIIAKCAKNIQDNIVAYKNETIRKEELRDKHEKLVEQNNNIIRERNQTQKEIERVTDENAKKEIHIEEMSKKYNEELEKLREKLAGKMEKLDKILKKVQEKKIDLEEMARDKENVESKIAKDERNKERLLEDKKKTEEELRNVTTSHDLAVKFNEETLADQEKEMKRLETREDLLRKQIADIKKQVAEERSLTFQIQSRMKTEVEEFNRAKAIHEQKRTQFEAKKKDLDKRLADYETKVAQLEYEKTILDNDVNSLSANLSEIKKNHKNLEDELTAKLNVLEPKHKADGEKYEEIKNQLIYMKKHTIEMNDGIVEMTNSKKMMVKAIEKTNEEIEKLTEIFEEVTIQSDSAGKLDFSNQAALDEVDSRNKNLETTHQEQMKDRTEYLKRLEKQLNDYLELNKELASRYRYLKYYLFYHKLSLMRTIESKLSSYASITDKLQIKSLQERMHHSLKDYLLYKLKFSENNYVSLNEKKNSIGDQIETIEGLLNHSVNYITRFLNNQVDYAVLRNQAIQRAYKQELIDKQNEEQKANNVVANDEDKKNLSLIVSLPNQKSSLMNREDTSPSKKSTKSVMFNLVNAN